MLDDFITACSLLCFIDAFQPTSFTAAAISSQSVELMWSSPLSAWVESYEVLYNDPHTNMLITSGTIDTSQSHYIFTNLDANVTYEFSILVYSNISNSSRTATAIGMYIHVHLAMLCHYNLVN